MPPEEEANMVSEVKEKNGFVGAAIGEREDPIERAEMVVKAGADILFLDVAHGFMEKTLRTTKLLRQHFGDKIDIASGNVATEEAAAALFESSFFFTLHLARPVHLLLLLILIYGSLQK